MFALKSLFVAVTYLLAELDTSDLLACKRMKVLLSKLPVSIVIIGVGSADFRWVRWCFIKLSLTEYVDTMCV